MTDKKENFLKLKGRVISCTHQISKQVLAGKLVTASEFEVFLKADYEAKYGEEPLYAVINRINYNSIRYGATNVSIVWEFLHNEVYISSFTIDKPSCTHPAIPMAQKFMFNKYDDENNDFSA